MNEYRAYELLYGFPQRRIEAGIAIGSAYVGRCWGGKASPEDLLPKTDEGDGADTLAERLQAFAISHNARITAGNTN